MLDTVLTPSQAAEQLGVKPVTLRRHALSYERFFGPLPRDPQDNRLYDEIALERLLAARALVDDRRAPSLEVALQSLSGDGALERRNGVEEKLEALAKMVSQLHEDNVALRQELSEMKRGLPVPQEDTEAMRKRLTYLEGELRRRDEQPQVRRPWWRAWNKMA